MADYAFCPRCATRLPDPEGDANPACACGWALEEPPRMVIGAIVEIGETILLVRNKSWPETWYGLVAGHLGRDETPAACIVRKVKEEVGLTGEVVDVVGIYPNLGRNQIVCVYHVVAHGHVVAGPDIAGVKQLPPEHVQLGPLATGLAVRDWMKRRRAGRPLHEA
jgi:ADP-ribose pyrophosphatase YjhB (NUDIX family)